MYSLRRHHRGTTSQGDTQPDRLGPCCLQRIRAQPSCTGSRREGAGTARRDSDHRNFFHRRRNGRRNTFLASRRRFGQSSRDPRCHRASVLTWAETDQMDIPSTQPIPARLRIGRADIQPAGPGYNETTKKMNARSHPGRREATTGSSCHCPQENGRPDLREIFDSKATSRILTRGTCFKSEV